MLHYHGTPITPRSSLITMAGRMFCVSFTSPNDLATCLRIGQSVMLDNGAFSAFTRGTPFDCNMFYSWIESHLAHPHWAVVPDEIGGTVEQQRKMVATWPYRKEYGAPVWHLALPLKYLFDLCNEWPRVCLGSSSEFWKVGSPLWSRRMDEIFNALIHQFGRIPWLHGLRMLGQGEGRWPLASADSTNVGRNFKTRLLCPDCMAQRIDSMNPPTLWGIKEMQGSLI